MTSGSGRTFSDRSAAAAITVVVTLLTQWHAVRCQSTGIGSAPRLGDERIVLQTTLGDVELALYPDVS